MDEKDPQGIIAVKLPREPELGDFIREIINKARTGSFDVVLDLSDVDIVTSSTLEKLLKERKLLGDYGRCLIFSNVSPKLEGIFAVTGTDGIFEISASLSNAVKRLLSNYRDNVLIHELSWNFPLFKWRSYNPSNPPENSILSGVEESESMMSMLKTTSIVVVRHGETIWNRELRLQGHRDLELTERGHLQAKAIAKRLRQQEFSKLYSSDFQRALNTAKYVTEVTGHQLVALEDLRERHYGIFEGLSPDDIRHQYPEHFEQWNARPIDFHIPEAEDFRKFFSRVIDCVTKLITGHIGQTIVVVTHAGPLDAILRHTLQIPLEAPRRFVPQNGSLNIFDYVNEAWILRTFGDVCHLLPDSYR